LTTKRGVIARNSGLLVSFDSLIDDISVSSNSKQKLDKKSAMVFNIPRKEIYFVNFEQLGLPPAGFKGSNKQEEYGGRD
jgi:hypothetical protein